MNNITINHLKQAGIESIKYMLSTKIISETRKISIIS